MPRKETSPVEERLRFVAGLLEGEPRRRCAINAAYVARPATRSWSAFGRVEGRRTLNVFA